VSETGEDGVSDEAMDRETYRVLVAANVGVASTHPVLTGDRSSDYDRLLEHDRALRRLLHRARDLLREMQAAPVEVHTHYRQRCAELQWRIYREAGFREDTLNESLRAEGQPPQVDVP
jgi:sugar phosphate isomerase/epimerase